MCIDIVLLDIFNTLGMPTSTTVSLVFELLGATFVVALFKTHGDCAGMSVVDLLNTEKALTIIIGIFLSVAIAFFFGTVIQFLTRMLFTFHFGDHLNGASASLEAYAAQQSYIFLSSKASRICPS